MTARSPRGVSAINGVVAVVLVAVLAAVALVVRPPAPPGIAEFAPQASKPITKAPGQQSAQLGNGTGQCSDGDACAPAGLPTPTRSALASRLAAPSGGSKGVPSALQCFTWPDGSVTQTFDPQSPPCIASWPEADRGNGGATAPGVTGTGIRVVVGGDERSFAGVDKKFATFFNNHFQFYGRKLRIDWLPSGFRASTSTAQGQRALVQHVKQQKAFAAFSFASNSSAEQPSMNTYIDGLADEGVIFVDGAPYLSTTQQAARNEPFQWSYSPHLDVIERNLAEFACSALVGRPAEHAGPALREKKRSFAAIYVKSSGGLPPPDVSVLREGLASCGADLPVEAYDPASQSAQAQMYLKLEQAGRTSLVLLNSAGYTVALTNPPNSGYQPEWILPGLFGQQNGPIFRSSRQSSQIFGLTTENVPLSTRDSPDYRALAEVDPVGAADYIGPGRNLDLYHELLLVASAVQMAGPRLTPQTFAEALWTTEFPNPGAAGAPSYQATVDARPHNYSMVRDIGLKWYSASEKRPGRTAGGVPGGFCYVGNGRRWTLGTWPHSDPGLRDSARGC